MPHIMPKKRDSPFGAAQSIKLLLRLDTLHLHQLVPLFGLLRRLIFPEIQK